MSDDPAGFNRHLGIRLIGRQDNVYVLELNIESHHCHDAGMAHGGVILALLDIAMARAARMDEPQAVYAPTVELCASFMRPVAAGRITARGWTVHKSRRLCRTEAEAVDEAGRLVAKGHAVMMWAGSADIREPGDN